MRILLVVVLLVSSSAMFSCIDKDVIPSDINIERQTEYQTVRQIEDAYELFNSIKKSNPNAVLTFSKENGKLISKIEVVSDTMFLQLRTSDKPLCDGDGVKFAKCVKKEVDKRGCVKVTTCRYCAYPCEKNIVTANR